MDHRILLLLLQVPINSKMKAMDPMSLSLRGLSLEAIVSIARFGERKKA